MATFLTYCRATFFFFFFFSTRLLPGTRSPAVGPVPCGVQVPSKSTLDMMPCCVALGPVNAEPPYAITNNLYEIDPICFEKMDTSLIHLNAKWHNS